MKFTKFGKALLMSALSAGRHPRRYVLRSELYGRLFVCDGHVTAQSTGNGIISGFKIDHNTGNLVPHQRIARSPPAAPIPVRAVLLNGSRFLYVLNRGVNARKADLHCTSGRSLHQVQHHPVRGWRQRHPHLRRRPSSPRASIPSASLPTPPATTCYVLDHDSPATIPHRPTRFVQLHQPQPKLRPHPRHRGRLLRRYYGLPDQRHHRSSHAGVNSQVTSATGSALSLLPGSGRSHRFCVVLRLCAHDERNTYNRRFGLPVHL